MRRFELLFVGFASIAVGVACSSSESSSFNNQKQKDAGTDGSFGADRVLQPELRLRKVRRDRLHLGQPGLLDERRVLQRDLHLGQVRPSHDRMPLRGQHLRGGLRVLLEPVHRGSLPARVVLLRADERRLLS